ncbi:hypothetical protein [Nonomuraea maheshkhaliensis]
MGSPSAPARERRRARGVLLSVGTVAMAALTVVFLLVDLPTGDMLASVLSFFVTSITLSLTVAKLRRNRPRPPRSTSWPTTWPRISARR